MSKIITSDFGAIHDALNRMIINEVKQALRWLPEQMHQGASLCRIVVSDGADYAPKDVAVDCVWLHNDKLYFSGHLPLPDYADPNDDPEQFEGGEGDEENAETDWLDITDFQYLIEQIADEFPDDGTCRYVREDKDSQAVASAAYNSVISY